MIHIISPSIRILPLFPSSWQCSRHRLSTTTTTTTSTTRTNTRSSPCVTSFTTRPYRVKLNLSHNQTHIQTHIHPKILLPLTNTHITLTNIHRLLSLTHTHTQITLSHSHTHTDYSHTYTHSLSHPHKLLSLIQPPVPSIIPTAPTIRLFAPYRSLSALQHLPAWLLRGSNLLYISYYIYIHTYTRTYHIYTHARTSYKHR